MTRSHRAETIPAPVLDAAKASGEDWAKLSEGTDALQSADLAHELEPKLGDAIRAVCTEGKLLADPEVREEICEHFRKRTGYRLTATEVYRTREAPFWLKTSFIVHSRPPLHFVY